MQTQKYSMNIAFCLNTTAAKKQSSRRTCRCHESNLLRPFFEWDEAGQIFKKLIRSIVAK